MSVLGFIYQWQNCSYICDIYVIPIKLLILKIYFIHPTPFFIKLRHVVHFSGAQYVYMFLRSHPFLLYFPILLQAFAWWPDLLAEHAEKFWALFTVDMDTALEAQPQDSWDSFPLFQLLNNFLRNDSEYLRSPSCMKWQGVATYHL